MNVNDYAPQNVSFGAHRNADKPASAIRAGASSMPAAWQTRNGPYRSAPAQSEQVTDLIDVASRPLRLMTATKTNRLASVAVIGLAVWVLLT